jgi:hypothetical protein
MITLVSGLIAAILFLFDFLGASGHYNLSKLALVFLAVAVAFIGYVPGPWRRVQ